ncbi:MAG: tetratricopeptide repeat protein, partial [Luteolibacter sp.]
MSADRPENATPLAEITHGPSAFERFLDRNQKLLAVLGILLVIATAAWVVYSGIQKSHQETAGAALQKATDLSAIRKVIDEFPDTPAASSAMILLANAQWDDNQQDTAIQTLRDFISAQPKHPAIATAQASLGSKLMQQGKSADAASAFQAIIDNPTSTYLDGFALISLGDLAKSAGDLDRAETYYQRARTDF